MLLCNHSSREYCSVLAYQDKKIRLEIKESPLIYEINLSKNIVPFNDIILLSKRIIVHNSLIHLIFIITLSTLSNIDRIFDN